MKQRDLNLWKAVLMTLTIIFSAPLFAAQHMRPMGGERGGPGMHYMTGMMRDMSAQMRDMSGTMAQGNMNPAQQQQMAERMTTMSQRMEKYLA